MSFKRLACMLTLAGVALLPVPASAQMT